MFRSQGLQEKFCKANDSSEIHRLSGPRTDVPPEHPLIGPVRSSLSIIDCISLSSC